ncbi:hypothetical protein [Pokkaliibacter plantistimulans]|uniref:hypothetical protein n=1 Tax=Pokkaliibacter plantistimulans TaxID=1635171 RepID=UPI001057BA23|nr:hypothetical protein [Pokkaliibacter plantistimulans]
MQIQQSLVGMGAIHDAKEQQTLLRTSSALSASVVSEEANQTTGSNTAAMSTATQVQLSPNALENDAEDPSADEQEAFATELISGVFGQSMQTKVVKASTWNSSEASKVTATPSADTAQSGAVAAVKEYTYLHQEESMSFAAAGSVTTAAGDSMSFNLQLEMSRSFTYEGARVQQGTFQLTDPLMISLNGVPPSLSEMRFKFDLDADGQRDQLALPNAGVGFLALDRNGDGRINDGTELFGTRSGNGFADLAKYDADHNGWIDESDPIFDQLLVWQKDSSGKDQLLSLKKAGIGAMYLGSVDTPFALRDKDNNPLGQLSRSGLYLKENGEVGGLFQVDLAIQQAQQQDEEQASADQTPSADQGNFSPEVHSWLKSMAELYNQAMASLNKLHQPKKTDEDSNDPVSRFTRLIKEMLDAMRERREKAREEKHYQQGDPSAAEQLQHRRTMAESQYSSMSFQLKIEGSYQQVNILT